MDYRVGLDMGVSSIGWAIVEMQGETPIGVVDLGVRKFNSGREDKTNAPLAQKRRQKRMMRRQRDRFLRRQKKLLNALKSLDLMPKDKKAQKAVADCSHSSFVGLGDNPYTLRAQALNVALPPFALGRVLFALNQRRGFKSGRLDNAAGDKPANKIDADIAGLEKAIADGGFRTLGEYYAHNIAHNRGVLDSTGGKKRQERTNLQTTRRMYIDEFNAIRAVQESSQKLTSAQWDDLFTIIFTQRPLKEALRGKCQLFGPQGKSHQRAYAADPLSQQLRVWQDINNLKIIEIGSARFLRDDERQKLWVALSQQKTLSISSLQKLLGLEKEASFNLTAAKSGAKLKGMETSVDLAKIECFGLLWQTLTPEQQTEIVEKLQKTNDEEDLLAWLDGQFDLSEDQLRAISCVKLEQGTSRFSPEALALIVPKIAGQKADVETNRYISVTEVLAELGQGYDQTEDPVERLDYYAKMMPEVGLHHEHRKVKEERDYGVIGNPTVHIALNQLRHVMNALIEKYGHPKSIALEVAKELKLNAKQKAELDKFKRQNEKTKAEMLEECAKAGVSVNENSRQDLMRYKLWKELSVNPLQRCCVYTGELISIADLFSAKVNIEHILPRARSLDDSMANLTLSTRDANKMKGDETPYEYYTRMGDMDAYARVLDRVPARKKWRFSAEAIEKFSGDDFWLSSMLNDTKYMSKVSRRYLEFVAPHRVDTSPGKLTAKARHQWVSEVFEKDRELDHRHHAVDALVVALINKRMIQQASIMAGRDDDGHAYKKLVLPCPMDQKKLCKQTLELLDKMVVSHRVDHGVEGWLHKETALHHNKDEVLKFKADPENASQLVPQKHQQGTVVHTNYYAHGGVHHIDFWTILEKGKQKVLAVPVYMHHVQKTKSGEKFASRPHPAAKFIMRVHKGDALMIDKDGVVNDLVIIRQIKPSKGNENLVYDYINQPSQKKLNTLGFSSLLKYNARKAYVDALGQVKAHKKKSI